MLTCEICGMEILLEEDMKTHLLLFHLENDHHCPLCGLSGVSYDELCFHITSAHPEDHQGQSPKSPDGSNARKNESKESKTNQSLRTDSSALADTRDLGSSGQSGTENLHLSPGESDECTKDLRKQVSEISDQINPNEIGEFRQIQNSPGGEKLLPCPMCTLVYSCPYLLQEHVELHLLEQESDSASEMCSPAATSTSNLSGTPGCDLRLAKELQHQEELKRRQEEARLEREEFKKLKRQYGLDGRGGYRRQMERSMERAVASGHLAPAEFHLKRAEMMERLASGIDDGSSRTQGIIQALKDYYQAECRDCVHVWLSADTDHYSSSAGDTGWGCGYRNFQMLLSSLHRIETYSSALQEKTVPCIPRVQTMIQEAWKEGLDPQGASHFNHQLERTEAWIGATEIYVLLTSLGLRGRIIDFHQPTGSRNTHPQLFDWVKKYFCPSSVSNRLSPRLILTSLPPLYLQHQGHSRTVVGLEQRKNGNLCLLLLDPASSASDTRKLLNRDTCCTAIQFIRKFPRSLKHKQYQLVAVEGVLSSEEKEMRILSSRNLCVERIP